MATETPNFGLIKPAQEDFYNVDDFNENADIIDSRLQVDHDAISDNASNLREHENNSTIHVTQAEKNTWNSGGTGLTNHIADRTNPHRVTAVQAEALPIAGGTLTGSLAIGDATVTNTNSVSIAFGNSTTTAEAYYALAHGQAAKAQGQSSYAGGTSTTASGNSSHAEGRSTVASGNYSHAEGYGTSDGYPSATESGAHAEGWGRVTASAMGAHAEGSAWSSDNLVGPSATGAGAHAEGIGGNVASARGAHAEGGAPSGAVVIDGMGTTASGYSSHAEGCGTTASGWASHAEGVGTRANGSGTAGTAIGAHAEGGYTYAFGPASHAEGFGTAAAPDAVPHTTEGAPGGHAEGWGWVEASANGAHAEGCSSSSGNVGTGPSASGQGAHAEGYGPVRASGQGSHAEGYSTVASGQYSHAQGSAGIASGGFAHSEGSACSAIGSYSHAGGGSTTATGTASFTRGFNTAANAYGENAFGRYNNSPTTNSAITWSATAPCITTGNGTSNTARSNGFRVTNSGTVYGTGNYNSSGADYAEYFEWADGNPDAQDRVGRFVTLNGDKIEIATKATDYILGVVSATPSVIGNADVDTWLGMWLTDEWGRKRTETAECEVSTGEFDKNGNEIMGKGTETRWVLNPAYDNEQEYAHREDRPEWDAVGMLGQIKVRCDGTVAVNGYCTVSRSGTATAADTGWRVIRLNARRDIATIIFR